MRAVSAHGLCKSGQMCPYPSNCGTDSHKALFPWQALKSATVVVVTESFWRSGWWPLHCILQTHSHPKMVQF